MTAIRLAAYVSAPQAYDWDCYARIDLDEEAARRLLVRRQVYEAAARACDVWAVRVRDDRIRFYRRGPEEPWCYKLDGDWWRMGADLEDFDDRYLVSDDVQTADVDTLGVHWHTYANDDIPIEVCTINWTQLEQVAAGHDPFDGGERCDFCNSALSPIDCIGGNVYYCRHNPRCAQAATEFVRERESHADDITAAADAQEPIDEPGQ